VDWQKIVLFNKKQEADVLEKFWRINCFGGFLCAKAVWSGMRSQGGGCIIFTGATASLRGAAGFSSFGIGKSGLRSLSQTLVQEGAPHNIHVCHVVIDAPVDLPILRKMTGRGSEELADPKQIAELYLHIVNQKPTCWSSEVDVHIKSKL
jgi:NAD(P)-dependent dehydrogenase (short-subunit alcohol dehydrogenase family)